MIAEIIALVLFLRDYVCPLVCPCFPLTVVMFVQWFLPV